jgi:hypothetical protein
VPEANSVTSLFEGLKDREDKVIQQLWDRYFVRLVKLASARMPRDRRREFDEEDVALSAFHSFCDRAARGQFPMLVDRDGLWRLLATLTTRKLFANIRHQSRQKRGGGQAAISTTDSDDLSRVLRREPTPAAAAQLADEYDSLFAKLDDPVLKTIALRKLEGFSRRDRRRATRLGPDRRPQALARPRHLGRGYDVTPHITADLPVNARRRIDEVSDRFEADWREGKHPDLADFLDGSPTLERVQLFRELLALELDFRRREGDLVETADYRARFPEYADVIDSTFIGDRSTIDRPAPAGAGVERGDVSEALRAAGYEVLGELGRGGMGIVFRARQTALGREVAVKVIKSAEFASETEQRRFRDEAEPAVVLGPCRHRQCRFVHRRQLIAPGRRERPSHGRLRAVRPRRRQPGGLARTGNQIRRRSHRLRVILTRG